MKKKVYYYLTASGVLKQSVVEPDPIERYDKEGVLIQKEIIEVNLDRHPLSGGDYQLGETLQDAKEGKYVLMTTGQIAFWETNSTASIDEIFAMELAPPPPPYVPTLQEAIDKKIDELMVYDAKVINKFSITRNGVTIKAWLTPEERNTLQRMIERAKLKGETSLTLVFGDIEVTESVTNLEGMLFIVDEYADATLYIREKTHKGGIRACQTATEALSYDVTQGWPTNPSF